MKGKEGDSSEEERYTQQKTKRHRGGTTERISFAQDTVSVPNKIKPTDKLKAANTTAAEQPKVAKANRVCEVCGATQTPQWRRGPLGKRTLCNACGVKWSAGRLHLDKPPAPIPVFSTDNEPTDLSEEPGFETDSPEWKLCIHLRKLKEQVRDVYRAQTKLLKLLYAAKRDDREIDRCYRRVVSAAKQSADTAKINVHRPTVVNVDAFSNVDGKVLQIIQHGNEGRGMDAVRERVAIDAFTESVNLRHQRMLRHASRMEVPSDLEVL